MIAATTLLLGLAFSLAGCQLLFEPKGELYVSVDGVYGSVTCELYRISYLEPGRSADTGENIYGAMARRQTVSGREWMVFEIPKGRWDIYMQYLTRGAFYSTASDRNTVNLELNEWAALWLPAGDWTSTREYSGDGAVSIPGL